MSKLKYNLVKDDENNSNITLFYQGKTYVAHHSHPAWDRILKLVVIDDDPAACSLFDIGLAVGEHLSLSERITYANGILFVDGDKLADGLAEHTIRMLQAGDDFKPFVRLMENILSNPSANSRDQLYRYIDKNNVTITPDGMLILYKYVQRSAEPGKPFRSITAGPAIVNGFPNKGKQDYVHQAVGDIVTMPRSTVVDDPNQACSSGLHVGSWNYSGTHGPVRLMILVHPRDVVSVPHNENETKIRVCRYKVLEQVTEEIKEPVWHPKTPPEEPPEEPKVDKPVLIGPHPSKKQFMQMKARAKAKKTAFVEFAQKKGWNLTPGKDGRYPSHWTC